MKACDLAGSRLLQSSSPGKSHASDVLGRGYPCALSYQPDHHCESTDCVVVEDTFRDGAVVAGGLCDVGPLWCSTPATATAAAVEDLEGLTVPSATCLAPLSTESSNNSPLHRSWCCDSQTRLLHHIKFRGHCAGRPQRMDHTSMALWTSDVNK